MKEGKSGSIAQDLGLIIIVLLALFFIILLRTAWVSEDAYITFRTIDNFVNGYGPTWNSDERVQAYTHPLWMFILSALYPFTRDLFYTSIFFSIAISLLASILLGYKIAFSKREAFLVILLFMFSKAFIDYSTSGLENPLTHLILVIFFAVYFKPEWDIKRAFLLSFIAAIAACNRIDIIILLLPPLMLVLLQKFTWKKLGMMVGGFAPFLFWEIFSVFYYGFPFPNPAYAKLNTGIGIGERLTQGLCYLLNSLSMDPLTPLVILVSLLIIIFLRHPRHYSISAGILLYLAYILYVGGDFMSGRFLTAPFLCSIILISRVQLPSFKAKILALIVILVVGFSAPYPPLKSDSIYSNKIVDNKGIADERGFFYQETGLLNAHRAGALPWLGWIIDGKRARSEGGVVSRSNVGFFGYYAGPQVHVVDSLGLGDALMARLPMKRNIRWRVGHYYREVPEGYLETLRTGQYSFKDKKLQAFYKKLSLIIRGKLWDKGRLRAIWNINLGKWDYLIDYDAYKYADMIHVGYREVRASKSEGIIPSTSAKFPFSDCGISIEMDTIQHAKRVEVSLDSNDDYQVIYCLGKRRIAHQELPASFYPSSGLMVQVLEIPAKVAHIGFDKLLIFPLRGDGQFGLGYLDFID